MELDYSIVKNNIDILTNLEPYQKLIVDENFNLSIDDRCIQFIRRTVTRDSKYDILEPLELTFNSSRISDDEKLSILKHISETLLITYPEFTEIHNISEEEEDKGLIQKLREKIQKEKSDKIVQEAGKGFSNLLDTKMNRIVEQEEEQEKKGEEPKKSFVEALLSPDKRNSFKRPLLPPLLPPTTNLTRLLPLSNDLANFLNVRSTCRLSTKEIELGIHKYILKNKLYSRETHKIKLDDQLAKLCNSPEGSEITNDVMKVYIFSNHVNN